MRIYFNCAGLICFSWGEYCSPRGSYNLHFFVKPAHWVWGKRIDWYDGPLTHYGCGPLFLLAHC